MPKVINLVGQKFGKLTVVERDNSKRVEPPIGFVNVIVGIQKVYEDKD